MTLLPNDAILDHVVNCPKTGLLAGMSKDDIHVSVSTISPHTSRAMAKMHAKHGSHYVGSPVFARPDGMAMKAAYYPVGG